MAKKGKQIDMVELIEPVEPLEETKQVEESIEQTESNIKFTSAYIDRIEEVEDGENQVVLYIGDDSDDMNKLVLPISFLPDNVYEGDYVKIGISYDSEKTKSAAAEALALLEDIDGGDDK